MSPRRSDIEKAAIEAYADRHALGPDDATRAWDRLSETARDQWRALARTAQRMAKTGHDRMVRPGSLTDRSR